MENQGLGKRDNPPAQHHSRTRGHGRHLYVMPIFDGYSVVLSKI